ncbi:MAG: hypothetical protein C0485_16130 [Pirellula sp.]|nr:hypothetical protein [Pirellula sp.]
MELLHFFTKQGQEIWSTRKGLACALLTVVVVLVSFFSGSNLSEITANEWAATIVALLLVGGLWYATTKIPKAKKGNLGFGVAISFEDEAHAEAIDNDFVQRIRDLLDRDNEIYHFQIVEFPQRIAKKLERTSALNLLHRSRCRFMIYGVGRIRIVDGKETHVFNLTGVVSHAPLPKDISAAFAKEFTSVFPTKLHVAKDNDVFSFEFTAQWLDVITRYIVGTAAFFTADLKYAEEMLLSAENRLRNDLPRIPSITQIKQSIPSRLRDIYRSGALGNGNKYRVTRDKEYLKRTENYLDKLDERFPSDYQARLLRAMTAFTLHRDMERAKKEIDACRSVDDATWMYSDAFLSAYEYDLERSYRIYRKAFEYPTSDQTLVIQVEEFIQIVIDEEPQRTDLYFCVGLINYRLKFDLNAARSDFSKFLNGTRREDHPRQHEAVLKWMNEIERADEMRETNPGT